MRTDRCRHRDQHHLQEGFARRLKPSVGRSLPGLLGPICHPFLRVSSLDPLNRKD